MNEKNNMSSCDDSQLAFPVAYEYPVGSIRRIIYEGVDRLSDDELNQAEVQCLKDLEEMNSVPHGDDRDYLGIEACEEDHNIIKREQTRRRLCREFCGREIWPEAASGIANEIVYSEECKITFREKSRGGSVSAQIIVSNNYFITDIGALRSTWIDDGWDPPEYGENTGSYLEEFEWLEQVLRSCTKYQGENSLFKQLSDECSHILSSIRAQRGISLSSRWRPMFLVEGPFDDFGKFDRVDQTEDADYARQLGFLFSGIERWPHIVRDELVNKMANTSWSGLVNKYCESFDIVKSEQDWERIWNGIYEGVNIKGFDMEFEHRDFYDRTRFLTRKETISEAAWLRNKVLSQKAEGLPWYDDDISDTGEEEIRHSTSNMS